MKRYVSLIFASFAFSVLSAQEIAKDTISVDTDYREDQFYAGITYDLLVNKPEGVSQQNFSRGIHLGFLRDFPVNEKRNLAVAVGLGYSYDLLYSNVLGLKNKDATIYFIDDLKENNVSKSYFDIHSFELPVEFRWRNSTPYSHRFWRVYLGGKIAYTYSTKSLFTQNGLSISFQNSDIINKWQFKTYVAFGYNTWNFYVQYVFTPLYKTQTTVKGEQMKMNLLQIGLMFYIL